MAGLCFRSAVMSRVGLNALKRRSPGGMDLGSAGECREKISFANEIRAAKWFGNRGYENRETRAGFRTGYGSNRRPESGNGIRDSLENACTAMLAFRGGQIVRSLHPRESYAEQERQYARP